MDQKKIDMFVMTNKECFSTPQWVIIKEKLAELPDEKATMLNATSFRNPTMMLIISIFAGYIGVDRFMLGHVGLGIGKLLVSVLLGWTVVGLAWWVVDIFLIQKATYEYNLKKFNESILI
ncbi:MAG: TM2 domain-containing protein [Bacteroidales bacterium]|nr:TM2 domain-containing protein [Bacteroidales bacterium]